MKRFFAFLLILFACPFFCSFGRFFFARFLFSSLVLFVFYSLFLLYLHLMFFLNLIQHKITGLLYIF